jgi:hypothetical protein
MEIQTCTKSSLSVEKEELWSQAPLDLYKKKISIGFNKEG